MRKDNATFCAMQGFASLSILEREAIALLRQDPFHGGYTDFTVALNRPKSQATNVRKALLRLAQIGRAARVHLIIATQTPIAKVLPTEIKCNFDARVGLRARSAQDSRNILGYAGLEDLPRYGLTAPPG